MKNIFKYMKIMVIILIMLISVMHMELVTIPRNKIEKNITASIPMVKSVLEVKTIKKGREYSKLHMYADEMILNIVYCMNDETPLKSIMEGKYYRENYYPNLEQAVNLNSNGNTEYIRYWHGSMIMIRPLLTIFNIEQIYYLFTVILIVLASILLIILIKKKNYILILALTFGLIITASQYVAFCLEYLWTYLIMFIVTIIGIKIESKENGNKNINSLMFITGIVTCFFDFLSTETITFLVPILFILTVRYKEGKIQSLKQEIKQISLWIFLWLIGYTAMWMAKWVLASIILQINALDYVTEKAMLRVNGNFYGETQLKNIIIALRNNILTLYPICMKEYKITWWGIVISIIIGIIALRKKDKKAIKLALIILVIGIIPYIRYTILATHSRYHYFFTFRAQIATIIAIVVSIYIIIDKNRFNEEIILHKSKGKINGEKSEFNNINTSIK